MQRPVEPTQYRSTRYGQALADCQAVASVGSKGDSYDNALAEALNSLYKAELIRNKGPWTCIDDVELATAEWAPLVQHRATSTPRSGCSPPSSTSTPTTPEPGPRSRASMPLTDPYPRPPQPDKRASTKPGA